MKRFLTATDKFGSINYEGINFFTNNIKRGSILKDGAFDWLTRSYFHSNSYFDSLVTAWQLQAQHVQVVSALISGNAQINGILTIGTLTISGSGSSSGSIVSSTGAIDFGGNNLLTTGKISVDSVTANQITSGNLTSNGITTNNITTDLLTSNHLTSDSITVHQATTTNLTSDSITSDYIITHNSATDTFNALNGTVETMHASSLHADTFSVAGTSTFSSLTDTTNGIALINKYGRLQRLNFSDNNSDVLFGNGSFGSLGTATGWQWYDTTVLLSTAPVVAVQNNLVVGGRVSIGAIRLSNGTGTDSMRTAQNFAIEAQKIFMRADTVNIKRRMEAKQIAVDTLT
ncbi:MAG: hypothetical protein HYY40_08790, partial [Bacteroidetes bacterium]|nr:hypothetical protein [Bacteroidota bacterium]